MTPPACGWVLLSDDDEDSDEQDTRQHPAALAPAGDSRSSVDEGEWGAKVAQDGLLPEDEIPDYTCLPELQQSMGKGAPHSAELDVGELPRLPAQFVTRIGIMVAF